MGPIAVAAAYYYCPHCRRGHKPWERTLRLKSIALTPASEEMVSLAGVLGSFADGADRVLQKLAGLRLSESTVERTAEAAGRRVREQVREGKPMGPTRDWAWQRDACGRRCAYVSLDATGVRQQGPGGTSRRGSDGLRGHGLQPAKRTRSQTSATAPSTLFIGLFRA